MSPPSKVASRSVAGANRLRLEMVRLFHAFPNPTTCTQQEFPDAVIDLTFFELIMEDPRELLAMGTR